MSSYEEYICKTIDQRKKDQAVVRKERLRYVMQRRFKFKCIAWTGTLYLPAPTSLARLNA